MVRASASSSSAQNCANSERSQAMRRCVDPAQARGDGAVAARPVPQRELDGEVGRGGELEQPLHLRPRVGRLALDARDHVLGARPAPSVSSISSSSAWRSVKCQ